MRYHGTNMVRCEIVTGITRTPLVSTYLPLSTLDHLPGLEEALHRFRDPIVIVDLNVDPNKARILRNQQVAHLLTEYSLIDLFRHFRQRCRFRNLKTWYQVWQGIVLRSKCDYIIGTDQSCFDLVGI